MVAKRSDGERLATIERLVRRIRRDQRELVSRLEWFLDPPPRPPAPPPPEATPAPEPPPGPPPPDHVPNARLKKLRPETWVAGRKAFEEGKAKAENPYRDTRGGFRNAWFGGWEEGEKRKAKGR